MRVLVDTNIFIDYFFHRNDIASIFFKWCVQHKTEIYVTFMSLRDIEYITHRTTHDKRKSKTIQIATYQICTKVIGVSADAAINSLYSEVDDYEDSLIIESAKEEMLDLIVTNNKKDFSKSGIPTFTPTELMNAYQS